jgi:hypothetical protein
MEERRTGGPCWALLLVIDEYTLVIRQGKDLGPRAALVIESVATEGRGFNFNGLIMGQNWKGTRTGGTEVREVLTSAFVHRSVKRQAAYLIQDDALAARAETLTKGWAIFAPTDDDPELIGIPLAEAADLATIAQLLAVLATGAVPAYAEAEDSVSPVSPPFPSVSAPVSGEVIQKRPGPPGEMDPARVEAVREAVQAGMAQGQILEQVWAVKAGGGAAYKAATDEFRAILAYLVGR